MLQYLLARMHLSYFYRSPPLYKDTVIQPLQGSHSSFQIYVDQSRHLLDKYDLRDKEFQEPQCLLSCNCSQVDKIAVKRVHLKGNDFQEYMLYSFIGQNACWMYLLDILLVLYYLFLDNSAVADMGSLYGFGAGSNTQPDILRRHWLRMSLNDRAFLWGTLYMYSPQVDPTLGDNFLNAIQNLHSLRQHGRNCWHGHLCNIHQRHNGMYYCHKGH